MASLLKPWRVPFNKATSMQITNVLLLAWWTAMLIVNHDSYEQSAVYDAFGLLPDIYWWAVATTALTVVCILPMVTWWRRNVNHSYRTKNVSMILSAAWWMFLAMIFFMAGGFDLGFGVHLALALGCVYESVQISKVASS